MNLRIDYSIICKKTDKFNIIENKLYEAYPELRQTENTFLFNGYIINKAKTIEENGIRNNDKILLQLIDDYWLLNIEYFIHTLSKLNN